MKERNLSFKLVEYQYRINQFISSYSNRQGNFRWLIKENNFRHHTVYYLQMHTRTGLRWPWEDKRLKPHLYRCAFMLYHHLPVLYYDIIILLFSHTVLFHQHPLSLFHCFLFITFIYPYFIPLSYGFVCFICLFYFFESLVIICFYTFSLSYIFICFFSL